VEDKARIVLDIEPELKEVFQERLRNCNKRWKMTAFLRNTMFHIIMMNNKDLENFAGLCQLDGMEYDSYMRLVAHAIRKGLWPSGFEISNSEMKNLKNDLALWETGTIDDDEIYKRIKQAKKQDYFWSYKKTTELLRGSIEGEKKDEDK